jgi:protein ImuA
MRALPHHLAEPSAGQEPLLHKPDPGGRALRLAALRAEAARLAAGLNGPDGGLAGRFRLGEPGLDAALGGRLGGGLDGRLGGGLGASLGASLGGGLKAGALHEAACAEAGDAAAALAFSLALAFRAAGPRRPVLLILEEAALAECGAPDGHGLAAHGFDPARLILVRARRAAEALWAFEEGLRCPGPGAAVCGLARLPAAYDLTASRRLVLAARAGGVTGLFAVLAQGGAAGAIGSAAETRWEIAARPSVAGGAGEPGLASFRAHLRRRRGGDPASFDLEWSHETRCFRRPEPAALSRAVPALSADRPRAPARARG